MPDARTMWGFEHFGNQVQIASLGRTCLYCCVCVEILEPEGALLHDEVTERCLTVSQINKQPTGKDDDERTKEISPRRLLITDLLLVSLP